MTGALLSSCAPVQFSKSKKFTLSVDCKGESCSWPQNAIICSPKINKELTTFTFSKKEKPSMSANVRQWVQSKSKLLQQQKVFRQV
jgi:hypothetical protein